MVLSSALTEHRDNHINRYRYKQDSQVLLVKLKKMNYSIRVQIAEGLSVDRLAVYK